MAISKYVRVCFNKPNKHEQYLISACENRLATAKNAELTAIAVEARIAELQRRGKNVSSAMIDRAKYYRGVVTRQMELYNRDYPEIAEFMEWKNAEVLDDDETETVQETQTVVENTHEAAE